LLVSPRFAGPGLNISRRDEIGRIRGVGGVAELMWVFGFHQEPSRQIGVLMLDQPSISALPELRLTAGHWQQLAAKPTGVFFSRTQAAKWNVKAGDRFPVQSLNSREDRSNAWPFEVLGIVDDPDPQIDWTPNIYGNYEYFDAARTQSQRGNVLFLAAIDDPADAEPICQKIDTMYANSATPTYCVPLQVDARSIVESVISMRQMSFGIAAAGLFMILFLSASSTAESARERTAEFAVLKTIGFGDHEIAALVFLEAAIPCLVGAVLGTAGAYLLRSFTSTLGGGSGLNLPPASVSRGIVAMALGAALLIAGASAVLPLRRLKRLELAPALDGR
jgi:putative ABC transport system permease protein